MMLGMGPVLSPEINEGEVIFRVLAPNAQKVTINGSWMDDERGQECMVKGDDGIWSIRISKPYPEIHTYNFNIDGLTITDPSNFLQIRDMFNFKSVFYIRGKEVEAYDYASKQHGKLVKDWYNSTAYGMQRRMSIYIPYGYEKENKDYPVLYLQHGGGGDEDAWVTQGRVCEIMDYLIEKKFCEPMIVVMPNSLPLVAAACEVTLPDEWIEDRRAESYLEGYTYVESIYSDIIPYIESNYKAKRQKSARAIAGLSMGGIYTMNVTQQKPELFDYIGIMSMGTIPTKNAIDQLTPIKKSGYKLYWIGCGKSDVAYQNAIRLMEGLDEMEMKYTYYGNVAGHTWDTWRKCLLEFAPLLF